MGCFECVLDPFTLSHFTPGSECFDSARLPALTQFGYTDKRLLAQVAAQQLDNDALLAQQLEHVNSDAESDSDEDSDAGEDEDSGEED